VQVLESEPIPPRRLNPAIPAAVETMCLKCLERSPGDRYPSAGALADDLERFLKGEQVQAQPRGISERLRAWSRREPALAAHLAILLLCTLVAQLRYQLTANASWALHLTVLEILFLWAIGSTGFQLLLRHDRHPALVRRLWCGADVLFLTWILHVMESWLSPLVIGYPLLIAASGLWFFAGLVWFTTAASVIGFGLLIALAYQAGLPLTLPHFHAIFAVGLIAEGWMIAYQVQRVRALSRYYEQRPF
jgi:serine/threonine-protein kinase